MTQIIARMGRKKVDRWRHRAELVNQGATLDFRCFCPALVNDCTMHDAFIRCCHQTRKLLMCRICFILTSLEASLPWLTMTYQQHKVERLWDPHPQCPWEEMVSMLVWIARALKPIAARGFTHWRLSRCIDGFLWHQMKAKVSNAAPVRYRNQSTSLCRTQVGHLASLAKKSIAYTLRSYPSANL